MKKAIKRYNINKIKFQLFKYLKQERIKENNKKKRKLFGF